MVILKVHRTLHKSSQESRDEAFFTSQNYPLEEYGLMNDAQNGILPELCDTDVPSDSDDYLFSLDD